MTDDNYVQFFSPHLVLQNLRDNFDGLGPVSYQSTSDASLVADHALERATPGNDSSLWVVESEVDTQDGEADLFSLTDRPGWLRMGVNYRANAWSDRGNAVYLLQAGPGEDIFMETKVDFQTGWSTEYPTASRDWFHSLNAGLVVFNHAQNRHVLHLNVRTNNDDLIISVERRSDRLDTQRISRTNKVIWLRLEHYGRGDSIKSYYKLSESADWTLLYEGSDSSFGESLAAESTRLTDISYGLMLKTRSVPSTGRFAIADFDYF